MRQAGVPEDRIFAESQGLLEKSGRVSGWGQIQRALDDKRRRARQLHGRKERGMKILERLLPLRYAWPHVLRKWSKRMNCFQHCIPRKPHRWTPREQRQPGILNRGSRLAVDILEPTR